MVAIKFTGELTPQQEKELLQSIAKDLKDHLLMDCTEGMLFDLSENEIREYLEGRGLAVWDLAESRQYAAEHNASPHPCHVWIVSEEEFWDDVENGIEQLMYDNPEFGISINAKYTQLAPEEIRQHIDMHDEPENQVMYFIHYCMYEAEY